ncbi:hypothetical protein [Pseudooceanicola sp. MF1-13]
MPDNDRKPGWLLFKLWGGDNRQYRFATHLVTCATILLFAWIVWG